MPIQDEIVMPSFEPLAVALEPVQNLFHSLVLLVKSEHLSGLGDWVARTNAALTAEERERHALVVIGFHYAVRPSEHWSSFPAYLDYLSALSPTALRDRMLEVYARFGKCQGADCPPVDWDAVLTSPESYLDFLGEHFSSSVIDRDLETRAYAYVVDPPAMQALIVSHMREMWERFLEPEWERVSPMLSESVAAFQQIDFAAIERLDAARLVTGQELKDVHWEEMLAQATRVTFVPSAHIGPYIGKVWGDDESLWLLFGARLPEGTHVHAPDLSRNEILTRLSALSDDTRLQILRLVADEGEKSSQDIMTRLALSQSSASRHLQQLSAVGYLSERRCNGAKCYALNARRIEDTLRAVALFLLDADL
ncbi:MAG: winged helix-turn-helix transcriptional regulator [Anaerolineae bacterium]|nr:winged helix-turn-helix transcriptional regulator [Anaerolineae bacterium]